LNTCLLIVDEYTSRVVLRELLQRFWRFCKDLEVIGECSEVDYAAQAIGDLKPDHIFLDIHMPGKDGFELLKQFPEPDFDIILMVLQDLEWEQFEVPTLLLQPYIENTIWHGQMRQPTEQKGLIRLFIAQKDLNIVITISDNGIGRQAAKTNKREGHESKGMGLNQKRIDLQNILLPHIHWSVDIKDAPNGGTEVVLTLSF